MIKRIAVIQDLSCIGRCSLGVAMAVLPAMGHEIAALPTAMLSTHTAFEGFTFRDLTGETQAILEHWQALDMRFDEIYIGYLGSRALIGMARRFLELFGGGDVKVIIDPAFADNGALYKGFDGEYVRELRKLCALADVILPNTTEACFLSGLPCVDDAASIRKIGSGLLGGRLVNAVITSVAFEGGKTGLICVGDEPFEYPHEKLTLSCHGTGDLFASVFAGAVARGESLEGAARSAADFTCDCLRYSMSCEDHRWYGVDFEPMLPELMKRCLGE